MFRSGITEKKLKNRRFLKTEQTIVQSFLERGESISMTEMAKIVGVSRVTIYHHHHKIGLIVLDYHRYIIRKYTPAVKKLEFFKEVRIETVIQRLLLFVVQNEMAFMVLAKGEDMQIYIEMMMRLEPAFARKLGLPKNSEEMFRVYAGEVAMLLTEWAEQGFPESKMDELKEEIVYLTETMRVRLAGLLK